MASRPAVRVTVAGATGLVGRAMLTRLSASPQVGPVTALVRQAGALGIPPARVQPRVVDYRTLGTGAALPATDWAFCALGTTIKVAGSQAAFRAVDVDAVLAFAQAARAVGATRFGLVSAMGADARSGVFYNRCKGEVEDALRAQGWPQLVIARPSLLLGARDALGQPVRPAEALAQRLMPVVGWLIPRQVRPITAQAVASALAAAVASDAPGVTLLLSGDLQALADRQAAG
jgi:uncharacterized protein YbjT (DUF2867 family)